MLQKMEELEDGLLVYIYILQVPEAKHGSSSFGIDLTGLRFSLVHYFLTVPYFGMGMFTPCPCLLDVCSVCFFFNFILQSSQLKISLEFQERLWDVEQYYNCYCLGGLL